MQPSFDKQFVRNWLTEPGIGLGPRRRRAAATAAARHRRRHPRPLYRCLRTHFGPAVRRLDRRRGMTEAVGTAGRQAGRAPPRASRRRLHRPLRMAARQVRPRGDRLPGGGERLHRTGHRPPGAAAAEDLRRDQGPHQGDRPVGAHPPRRLVVLRPQLRGQAVRRAMPLPDNRSRRLDAPAVRRAHRDPRRAGAARRERRGRGPRLLRAGRGVGQRRRPHAGLLGRRPSATSDTRCGSRTYAPASSTTTRSSASAPARPGPPTTAPSTTRRSTTRGGPTPCGGTGSARACPPRRSTTSPTSGSGSRWAAPAATSTSSSPRVAPSPRRSATPTPPTGTPSSSRCWPRREGVEYSVEHAVVGGEDRFLILHNDGAENFTLVEAPVSDPTATRTLIEHRDDVRLDAVDAFVGHIWWSATAARRCRGSSCGRSTPTGTTAGRRTSPSNPS